MAHVIIESPKPVRDVRTSLEALVPALDKEIPTPVSDGVTDGRLMHALALTAVGDELLDLAHRAVPLLKQHGHPTFAANLHGRAAIVECNRGNFEAAQHHLTSAASLLTPELRSTLGGINVTLDSAFVRGLMRDFDGARACLEQLDIPPGLEVFRLYAQIVRASIDSRDGHVERAIELLTSIESECGNYPQGTVLAIQIFGNLAGYRFRLGDTAAAENDLREALRLVVELREHAMPMHVTVSYARLAATIAGFYGRSELAAHLLGACDAADKRSGQPSVKDDIADEVAAAAIVEHLSPERAEALRNRGASEDLYELLEEFLAQPAADANARPSATSSPRATSVMRSSSN